MRCLVGLLDVGLSISLFGWLPSCLVVGCMGWLTWAASSLVGSLG